MNRTYVFKYRRYFFWTKITVSGHKLEEEKDKMLLFYPDGGVREIRKWSEYELWLQSDWVLATKESIKEEAGNA